MLQTPCLAGMMDGSGGQPGLQLSDEAGRAGSCSPQWQSGFCSALLVTEPLMVSSPVSSPPGVWVHPQGSSAVAPVLFGASSSDHLSPGRKGSVQNTRRMLDSGGGCAVSFCRIQSCVAGAGGLLLQGDIWDTRSWGCRWSLLCLRGECGEVSTGQLVLLQSVTSQGRPGGGHHLHHHRYHDLSSAFPWARELREEAS